MSTGASGRGVARAAEWADDRLSLARLSRGYLRKVFPEHWSFMLGEIALWSFVVLLVTGTFLTFWFNPSMSESTYQGSYAELRGVPMSDAYASTLHLTFDVRGGLLIRQMHHWAAMIFIAAMFVHMMRVFVTGAFRKPREVSWLIGATMLLVGILEGFLGYSLPDDLLSGTGLRIADGLIKATPVVGSYLSFLLFGGSSPATR
jgi:ubiquinol-cytochrome c reductase cytochrome b subunit